MVRLVENSSKTDMKKEVLYLCNKYGVKLKKFDVFKAASGFTADEIYEVNIQCDSGVSIVVDAYRDFHNNRAEIKLNNFYQYSFNADEISDFTSYIEKLANLARDLDILFKDSIESRPVNEE